MSILKFIAIVDNEPGSTFGIWFPDIPGCFSAADEEKDISANACTALLLHFQELKTLPIARSRAELLRDKDVQDAIDSGAYMQDIICNH